MKEDLLRSKIRRRNEGTPRARKSILGRGYCSSWSLVLLATAVSSTDSFVSAFSPSKSIPRRFGVSLEGSVIADWEEYGQSWLEFPPRWAPFPIRRGQRKADELPNLFEQLEDLKPQVVSAASAQKEDVRDGDSPVRLLPFPSTGATSASTANMPRSTLVSQFLPQLSAREAARINDMTLGAIVSLGVLFVLAFEDDSSQFQFVDTVQGAAMNIVDSTIPANAYEIVSVALGETLAGITGAIASLGLNILLMSGTRRMMEQNQSFQRMQAMINEALAESDYFLARATILPLLEAVGLSPSLATVSSSLAASLPYQLVKWGKQQKEARKENENRILEKLLEQQKELQAKEANQQIPVEWKKNLVDFIIKPLRQFKATGSPAQSTAALTSFEAAAAAAIVDPSKLIPIKHDDSTETKDMPLRAPTIDGVEVFADTCKWLSYSLLMKDFSGTLSVGGEFLGPGLESGFYGLLATLTSQIYADFLYVTARAGPVEQQEKARSRTAPEWISLYVRKSISAFTLFGVYATVQLPVLIAVNALLSGGIDSCVGSTDLDLCMETYYTLNPPSADIAAELRALVTTLYSFCNLPTTGDVGGFGFYYGPSADAQLRAIITTLVSLWHRLSAVSNVVAG
ncbi:expressed unknown protein [Seminavis robusta]|uniref:Uncharacterized protein n=1 Tax=Seminavis robusta TaxID=568900 RepID=A0A9N8DV23_9STRA|nr:expressed unknown protein [Seminavis robusta]|eukprot:Sro314_g115010.1 n/a (628) ;mRNA; f:14350-16233